MVKEIHLKQYFSQVHTIQSSNEAFNLNLPNGERNVTHLLACFLQTGRTGTIKKSSNDFSSVYTNAYPEVKINYDATTNLQMIIFILDKHIQILIMFLTSHLHFLITVKMYLVCSTTLLIILILSLTDKEI